MAENEQNVFLKNRNELKITGIVSVDSFDEFRISATTVNDALITVEGENLSINEVSLDNGVIEASGVVTGIYYDERNKISGGGLFKGLFGRK